MGKKGPMPNYATIDDYIANQPELAQEKLNQLRQIVKNTIPNTVEIINYKIPAFTIVPGGKRDQQVMMAAYSNFIGFYPFPSTITQFSTALKLYKHGKGSVQFPLNQPLPEDLIVQMLQYRREELLRNA